MSTAQLAIIISMSISGGIIGYLAARLKQEKNKVKILEAARRVTGEMPYDTLAKKLSKDYTDGKITHEVFLTYIGALNRVYGREEV